MRTATATPTCCSVTGETRAPLPDTDGNGTADVDEFVPAGASATGRIHTGLAGGGCSIGPLAASGAERGPLDPTLPLFAALATLWLVRRRRAASVSAPRRASPTRRAAEAHVRRDRDGAGGDRCRRHRARADARRGGDRRRARAARRARGRGVRAGPRSRDRHPPDGLRRRARARRRALPPPRLRRSRARAQLARARHERAGGGGPERSGADGRSADDRHRPEEVDLARGARRLARGRRVSPVAPGASPTPSSARARCSTRARRDTASTAGV